MSDKNKEYLISLIHKLKAGSITNDEAQLLANFFMSHQESQDWPFEIAQKDSIKEKLYSRIKSGISIEDEKTAVKIIPLYRTKAFKYIAAASIALLISLTFLINKENIDIPEPAVVDNNIEVGTDKAVLTLDDGSNIALEKGKRLNVKNAKSNGEKIVYKKTNLKANDEIAYNYLTIPRGGQFVIELEDKTKVWLNSASKLKYPTAFKKGEERVVELLYGEAYFDVSHSTNHGGSSFKVLTNNQEVKVLGTEFNIKAYKDEEYIYTTLVEGKVSVGNQISGTLLDPSQQSIVSKKDSAISTKVVNVIYETMWRKGDFSFERMPLKNIAKVLGRWYDVDFVFEDEKLKDARFIGEFSKYQNIEEILLMIKNTNFINDYEIKDKTILIR